jgi:hypothetical protein
VRHQVLGYCLAGHDPDPLGKVLHALPEFGELADKYGLTYGTPDWMDDIRQRYGLSLPSHSARSVEPGERAICGLAGVP